MQEKSNRRNLKRKLSQENSSKPEVQLTASNQQANGASDQITNPQAQATDEAIDVLSYMGFKL
ncbi:MAG: hypothetical protein H7122_13340 [Chitinophagaceae bacterium]|nr:hypothetical protein [Chitinophagaceae bacterium]